MAGKIRRVISILILLTAILVTQLPVSENLAAGSAGEYQMNKSTLVKYTGTASTVSVSDTVKIIGEEAFAGNNSLNVVSAGENTKEISFSAFSDCIYLSQVTIGNNVDKLDNSVFSGCSTLSKITLGDSVRYIGNGVFAGCNSLKTITISENNNELVFENGALYNRDKTILYAYMNGNQQTTYKMPDSVEKIREYAFWGNENLENVTLSSSLKEISGYAFANCKNLKELTIPYAVRSIDAKAFENCISLENVTIPSSTAYIHSTAFDGCPRLNIIADEGSVAADFFASFDRSNVAKAEQGDTGSDNLSNTTVENEDGSVTVHSATDSGQTGQSQITVSGNGENNGTAARNASTDPSNVDYMPQSDPLSGAEDASVLAKTIVVNGNAVLFLNRDRTSLNQGNADSTPADETGSETVYDEEKGGYLPKYAVTDGKIAAQAYYGDTSLNAFTFPEGVSQIGDFAFARSGLKAVTVPQGVTSIGYGAFYHCDELASVSIPAVVEDIESSAFLKTPWLDNFYTDQSRDDFLIVGDHILLAYKGNAQNVVLPQGIKKIAPECFLDHTELQTVELPDSLTEIGEDAFAGCKNLHTVTGGSNVEKIADRAFMGCPLQTFHIPSSVKELGLRAVDFQGTNKENNTKAVVFDGEELPSVSYGKTSQRLLNEEYRRDALYNVLFAVVDEKVSSFENTVLAEDGLGFSGLILSPERDKNGNETGNMLIRENRIFSQETLEQIPDEIQADGKNYSISGLDKIRLAQETDAPTKGKEVAVTFNGTETEEVTAAFSEDEGVGRLYITEGENTNILQAYQEIFGNTDTPQIHAYQIKLMDLTETVPITKFGKALLSITMPVPQDVTGEAYHVVCLDEDGQLEEAESTFDVSSDRITFQASHLSEYAIYATGNSKVTLSLKDGRLVKNFKKDASPDTGDYGIPPQYAAAAAMVFLALFLFFYKGKKKHLSQPGDAHIN